MRNETCIALRSLGVALALALAGCANPIVQVDLPGHSLESSRALSHEPESMGEALQKLSRLRATYYEAIREQTGASQNSLSGLVWLGTAIAGMAAGNMHSDAIVGSALVGGTVYGLTSTQLTKRRIDVWQAGIDALDCAREATAPLNVPESHRRSLRQLVDALPELTQNVRDEMSVVQASVNDRNLSQEQAQELRDALKRATDVLGATEKFEAAAMQFLWVTNGGELSARVDKISSQVTNVMGNVALSVSSIEDVSRQAMRGVELLAPGARVPELAQKALAGIADKASAHAAMPSGIQDKLVRLNSSVSALASTQARGAAYVGTVDSKKVSKALSKCGVANVIADLSLEPPSLAFVMGTAASRGVQIKGGVPPYRVKQLAPLPDGVKSESFGDDSVTVSVTDKAPAGEYRLVVSDISSPPQTQQVVVTVAAMTAAPDIRKTNTQDIAKTGDGDKKESENKDPGKKSRVKSTATTEQAWRSFQAGLMVPFSGSLRGVTFKVVSAELAKGRIFVKLECSKKGAGLPVIEVREELKAAAPDAVTALITGEALDKQLNQIDLKRSLPCVKE